MDISSGAVESVGNFEEVVQAIVDKFEELIQATERSVNCDTIHS